MASEARIGIRSDSKQAEGDIKGIRGLLQDLGKEAKTSILTGVGLAGGVAAFNVLRNAASAAVDYVGDAIGAASDLNETISKTGVILGQEALPELEKWAEGMATAFGQSKQQALDAASTFAIFGKSAGVAGNELVTFSTDLAELGGDLSSFFGGAPEEAILAIGAALRGESEPIRRYGVLLNEATLRQRALAMGIIETITQALTPQQRVLAAQAEILAQTADAQGDYARTSDDLAQQQKTLNAQLENLSAEIGQELLPIMIELAHVATEDVLPALRELFGVITSIPWGEIASGISGVLNPLGAAQEHFELLATAAKQGMSDTQAAVREGRGQIAIAAEQTFEAIPSELAAAAKKAVADLRELPGDLAEALRAGSHDVDAAMEQLTEDMEKELDDAVRLAYLQGLLVSDELSAGFTDSRDVVQAQAKETQRLILEEIALIESGAAQIAIDTGTSLAANLAVQQGKVSNAAGYIRDSMISHLQFDAGPGGEAVGSAFVSGAIRGMQAWQQRLLDQMAYFKRVFGGSLPTEGPLQHPETGGKSIAEAWIGGMTDELRGGLNLPTSITGPLQGSGGFMGGAAPMGGVGPLPPIYVVLDGRELTESTARWGYYAAPGGPSRLPR